MANYDETINTDMKIYDLESQTSYLERIQDVIDVFNALSRGTINFRSEAIPGDFKKDAFYKIAGSVAHRDVNSQADVGYSNISADEMIGVKSPWSYGPYASTDEAFKRRARSVAEFYQLCGQDMADAVMKYWLECALASLEGAINTSETLVVPADLTTYGKKVFTAGLRPLGDRADRIALWVMNSSLFFDIIDEAIDGERTEEIGTVIYGGSPGTLGRPVLVTDVASDNTILGLQAGAISIIESQAPGVRSYQINDRTNLAMGFRGEGVFNIEVLGFSYSGSANPNKTSLGTSDNWTQYATDDKNCAGVLIDTTETS